MADLGERFVGRVGELGSVSRLLAQLEHGGCAVLELEEFTSSSELAEWLSEWRRRRLAVPSSVLISS
jgi:hypothetical protein